MVMTRSLAEARSAHNAVARDGTPGSAAPTIYLHIGAPKSGTTYLQSRFSQNAERAREQGLLWPGPRWSTHVDAVRDLRTLGPESPLDPSGAWMTLARTARSWSGQSVLISMEWLAGSKPEHVAHAVETLQPHRVEIVCTARDILRGFVAQWQEMTKNCRPWSYDEFAAEMVEDAGPARDRFWAQQDVPQILRKWADHVPWERIHLVTVPPKGSHPDLLWQRFCQVVGIDGAQFDEPQRDNESLGVVSSELMHRINLTALRQQVPHEKYQRVLHTKLADAVLAPRRDSEEPIAVTADLDTWIRDRAEVLVEQLRGLPIDVVGDLADLLPGDALAGRLPEQVSESELLETCVEALVAFGMKQYDVTRRLRSQNEELRREVDQLRRTRAS